MRQPRRSLPALPEALSTGILATHSPHRLVEVFAGEAPLPVDQERHERQRLEPQPQTAKETAHG